MKNKDVIKRINFLRKFILIHSYIYYQMNESLVTDDVWQEKADELVRLQQIHPDLLDHPALMKYNGKQFNSFDGSTGFHLHCDLNIVGLAQWLVKYHWEINPDHVRTKTKPRGVN